MGYLAAKHMEVRPEPSPEHSAKGSRISISWSHSKNVKM